MAALYRNLFRDEALNVFDSTEAHKENGQTHSDTDERGVERVEPETLLAKAFVLPRPEDVNAEEGNSHDDSEEEPEADQVYGALFSWVVGNREALLAVCNSNFVEFGTKTRELIVAHRVQFLRGVFFLFFTHERDPIHRAAATQTTIPTSHIIKPSVTGPMPPSP